MNDSHHFAVNLIRDLWADIDDRLAGLQIDPEIELQILGAFQHSAEVFGFSRRELGLPEQDADILYVKRVTRGR